MALNPENKKPSWPCQPKYTSPTPNKNSKSVPPRTQIHAANGLPHSPSPRSLGDIKSK